MATHVRTAIRKAVVAALGNLETVEKRNVFDGRVHPLQELELPALLVYGADEEAGDEEVRVESSGTALQERSYPIVVDALFKDLASLDDKGDQVLAEVEEALFAPGAQLGGGAAIRLERVRITRDGDGEQAGRLRMVFSVSYYTAQGAPGVAL